jgi:secreted trypsin-like serine protease
MRRAALILTSLLVLFMTAQGEAAGIWNGTADNGRHPYAGALGIWASAEERPQDFLGFCSASLLSPTLVLTAAHCTVGGHHAYFTADEEVNDPNVTIYRGKPFTYPGYCPINPLGRAIAVPVA